MDEMIGGLCRFVLLLSRQKRQMALGPQAQTMGSRKVSAYCTLWESTVYCLMVSIAILVVVVGLAPVIPLELHVVAADILPPAPLPGKRSSPPATTPENPSEEGQPAIPPSTIDPGIQQRPPTIPDARSVVPPPTVDRNMSVNPEASPPSEKAKKRQGDKGHEAPRGAQ